MRETKNFLDTVGTTIAPRGRIRIVRVLVMVTLAVLIGTGIPPSEALFAQEQQNSNFDSNFARTFTVDDDGPADFSSLVKAVEAAGPSTLIRVEPGVYVGQLVIQKNDIVIIGSGANKTFIESEDIPVIYGNVPQGILTGFTIRYTGTDPHSAVVIFSSSPVLQDNVITGASLVGVDILGSNSLPVLQGNRISHNTSGGVLVHKDGQAILSSNFILNNGRAGIEVKGPAKALLLANLIEANGGSGVFGHNGATLQMENNLVLANSFHGISLVGILPDMTATIAVANADPEGLAIPKTAALLRGNSVLFNKQIGIRVRGKETTAAALIHNMVAGNGAGLLSDNANETFYNRNFVTMNRKDYSGKGIPKDEVQLGLNFLISPEFTNFSNPVLRMQALTKNPIADEAPFSSIVLGKAESVVDLQQMHLFTANLYQESGFLGEAAAWYRSTIRLDSSSDLAEQARANLEKLQQDSEAMP